ncbi:multidrug effflux MFS transporter [Lysobacter gummosus]|uniref:multidrug effflux MFS transporter n=1 Tax=Lysobacter gummosus TaxID=262324 RepID=UPI0036320AD2
MSPDAGTSVKAPSLRRLTLLLGGLAMFGPFSIDTIFPAFAVMGTELNADKLQMQQTISVYLAAYALMSIVHGPLSDAIGRRKVIIGGLTVFTLASAACALSTDLPTLLFCRAIQGLSAGVGLIVGRAVIRDLLHGDDAQRLMSQVMMVFGIAPAIAPIIGEWILGRAHWPAIFWFLVAFSVLLLASVIFLLPETHPPQARLALKPKRLLRDYVAIFLNPRFQRLTAVGAFNFGALFLYIASAPAFVYDLLKVESLAWFFVPTIGGMVLGSFVSGRAAGKISGDRLVNFGFSFCALALAINLGYNLWTDTPQVPWAVIPMCIGAFGIALVFPIVTLSILDMYPHQRGSASSLQAFAGLVVNALMAGAISPLLSDSVLHLAIAASVLTAVAWGFWRWEAWVSKAACARIPEDAVVVEPQDSI